MKCNAVFVMTQGQKIWKSKLVHAHWTQAFIILLSKSEDRDEVSELRRIAIILIRLLERFFFSIISFKILQIFKLKKNYISRYVPKGFTLGVSGCIEHTFALLDAKNSSPQIITTWFDLANVCGSARHNVIQFALKQVSLTNN